MLLLIVLCLLSFQDVQPIASRTPKPVAETAKAQARHKELLASLREHNVEVEFTGSTVFSSEELLKMLAESESAADYFADGVAAEKFGGDATEARDANYEKLDISLKLLRNALASRGYLEAKVGPPKLEQSAPTRRITIPVTEGARYRIGDIKFDGAKIFTAEELGRKFPLKKGDVASGEAIYDFFFVRLKKDYGERGHIQYSADPEPTFHPPADGSGDGVVDYSIAIDEGNRFVIDSVDFAGYTPAPERVLRRALSLRTGETFNQALLDQSLKDLGALGLFDRIDPDRDVDYETAGTYGELSHLRIVIRLAERRRP